MTWRTPAISAAVALVAGAVLGWHLHPDPAPKVEVHEVVRTQVEYRDRVQERVTEGPERVTTHTVTREIPRDVPGPERVVTVTQVVERGPVVTERAEERAGVAQAARETAVVVTPPPTAPAPRWAVSGGALALPGPQLTWQVGAGVRLLGPVWAEAWVAPQAPAAGIGVRVAW